MIGVQVILVPSDKWFKGNICTVFHRSTEEAYLTPAWTVENEFEASKREVGKLFWRIGIIKVRE